MTTAQAAEYLGVNDSRVRQLVRSGALSARKDETPRGVIYWLSKSELDSYKQRAVATNVEKRGKRGRPLKVKPENKPDTE